MLTALNFYFDNDYTLILLGDIEELWQFSLEDIIKKYEKRVYAKLREFAKENRIYKVVGNHDLDWKSSSDTIFKNNSFCCVSEALKMEDNNSNINILLVHGHQGTYDSDVYSASSRFWVHLFRVVEPVAEFLGLDTNTSMTQSEVTMDYEKTYYNWARENKVAIICGHSHRAIFASRSYIRKLKEQISALQLEIENNKNKPGLIEENSKKIDKINKEIRHEINRNREVEIAGNSSPVPCYFNSGCGIYKDGITSIEIADDIISLNKWSNKSQARQSVPYDSHNLSDYIYQITAA